MRIKKVRNRRGWRRYYYPGRPMYWRRRIVFEGVQYETGDPVPDDLVANKGMLRRFALKGLAGFQPEPLPEPVPPEGGDENGQEDGDPASATLVDGSDSTGDENGGGGGGSTTDMLPAGGPGVIPDPDPVPEDGGMAPPAEPKPGGGKRQRKTGKPAADSGGESA